MGVLREIMRGEEIIFSGGIWENFTEEMILDFLSMLWRMDMILTSSNSMHNHTRLEECYKPTQGIYSDLAKTFS